MRSTTPARTPECPSASTWARSSSIARASSRESGGPTAVACERTIPSWSAFAWSGSMRSFASDPNPVVTPYTVSLDETARSITSRAAPILPDAAEPSSTSAPSAASTTSSSESGSPTRIGTAQGYGGRPSAASRDPVVR
jgi:hypothetical protein